LVYLEPFYALIRERIVPELAKLDAESSGIRHWYVVEDSAGVDVTDAEEGTDFSKALRSRAEAGASAAYVTYTPGPPSEHLLAYAILAGGSNSDVRRSFIARGAESITLGPWEDTVS
jgi:hypothetical protein